MADVEQTKEKKKKKTGVKSSDGPKKSSIKKEEVSKTDENKEKPTLIENDVGPQPKPQSEPQQPAEEKPETKSEVVEEKPENIPSEKTNEEHKVYSDAKKPEISEVQKRKRSSIKEQPYRVPAQASKKNVELFTEIDDQKLHQLKEAFAIFDFNHDGIIDREDLRKTLVTMGKDDATKEEIDQMMSEALNPLDFDAFVILLGYRTLELDPEEVIRDALSRWDYDGSGLISEERIRHDLMTWGDKFTPHEVDVALEDAPIYGGTGLFQDDRMIDYSKFCQILCGLRKKTRDPQIEDFL